MLRARVGGGVIADAAAQQLDGVGEDIDDRV
jgi:hypothetical protein